MNIVPTKKFTKQFRKLSNKRKDKFFERVEVFSKDRKNSVLKDHALHHELQGLRSFSVTGDIRVVYKVIGNNTFQFIQIGTHSELYE